MPMYTQQVLLLTGTATGLILMPASIAQAFAAPLFGRLLDKKGGRFTVLPATVMLLVSLAVLWLFCGLTRRWCCCRPCSRCWRCPFPPALPAKPTA